MQRKEEDPVPTTRICELDVKEWAMELRENKIIMDEFNVLVKEEKLKDIEETEYRQRKAREEEIEEKERKIEEQRKKLEEERILMAEQIKRQTDISEREMVINQRHKELLDHKQSLKEMELVINQKKSILEITLKVKDNAEKIAEQINKQTIEIALNQTNLNLLKERDISEREKDVVVKEKEVALRHQKLDRQESQIDEKNKFFEIAVQMNELR